MTDGYICAFRGRRDDYQVPLALAEAGKLSQFVTDIYAGPALASLASFLPATWRNKVLFRRRIELPPERIECLWRATLVEHLRHRAGISPAATFAKIDRLYSEVAADHARRLRAHLLLYTPYAWEAFTASYLHQPKRLLFQFHPHAPYEKRLLEGDVARYPEIAQSFAQETGRDLDEGSRRRVDDCWRHADRILCASSFTQHTLLEAGADPARCFVAPYGISNDLYQQTDDASNLKEGFHALFVGSGVQRKGLHHLLLAWTKASLPKNSSLVLVCRTLDPGLQTRVTLTPGVKCLRGVSPKELVQLYQRSTLFVMPSLVEGFGQVYLEALVQGCPVLGTANTCLPDIGTPNEGVFITEVADIDALVSQLEVLAHSLPNKPQIRALARTNAVNFTWSKFRATVTCHL